MEANPTLDQLQVFIAVAETGSFSAAARKLNRAQSVISYAINNLEQQLDIVLFERAGLKQPRLTNEGRAMLEDARRIVAGLLDMRARARGMNQGLEADLSLAISNMVPLEELVRVLHLFRAKFPTVSLTLNVGELGMVAENVLTGKSDLGFGGALLTDDDRLFVTEIGRSSMIPVASVDHPLAQIKRPLTLADVRDEVQLVVTDASGQSKGRDFNVLSYHIWRVSDVATKHQLIKGGLGWGGLPEPYLKDDLRSGRLVQLDLDAYRLGVYPIFAMNRISHPLGPAASWIVERFKRVLDGQRGEDDDLVCFSPSMLV
jgi:DNA-binding transcriptional LysR family regulator